MILLFAELALVLVVSKVHIDQTVAVSFQGSGTRLHDGFRSSPEGLPHYMW